MLNQPSLIIGASAVDPLDSANPYVDVRSDAC
jgi:hypothetical protein